MADKYESFDEWLSKATLYEVEQLIEKLRKRARKLQVMEHRKRSMPLVRVD